ncbi:MAG: TVP38/TMEM64 family protein [Gemmatimonadaceae bacterium]
MPPATARPTSRPAAVLRLAALAALLLGAALAWWKFGPTDLETLRAAARRARAMRDAGWSKPAFLLVYTVVASLGLPITPLTLAAGFIFGALVGASLSWAGAVIGAAGGYLIARRLGANAVRTLAGARAPRIERLSESTGFLTLLRLQLIPVLPLGALNVACGVARVRFATYVAAAAVGVIPGSVIYAYFADQVIAGAAGADARSRTHIVVASLLLLSLTFVPTVAGKLRGKRAKAGA